MIRRSFAALVLIAAAATPAAAQVQNPIPRVAFDVRVFYSGLGQDEQTATGLGLAPTELPKRGLGGFGGLHFYPIRGKSKALGIGGEAWIARGRAQKTGEEGQPDGPLVEQRLMGMTPVVTLNFGHERGWSYLGAGMGPLSFITFTGESAPEETRPYKLTINMGGGARWFPKPHLGVGFDLRFFMTRPQEAVPGYPARGRTRLLILSGGISFK